MPKYLFLIVIFIFISEIICGQENEKPVKVPSFIIFNKFTNKESLKLIRWIKWTDDQKLKIFLYAQEQNKIFENAQNEIAKKVQEMKNALTTEEQKNAFDERKKTAELTTNSQKELAENVQKMIEALQTEDQKKEFSEKTKNAELMKMELDKNLKEFDEKTKQLKGAPFNVDLYHILTSTVKYFHFPEIWALTRTPLNDEEKMILTSLINQLMQMEQGFHLAVDKNAEELNIKNDYSLFDFNMKKDSGTAALNNEIKKFSKQNQEIFNSLVVHYINQKKTLLAIYQKYGEKTKFEIPMSTPKIMDIPAK